MSSQTEEKSWHLSDEIWRSYKLGFHGAQAGMNKKLKVVKENDYIQVGTILTIKALVHIIARVSTVKLGTFVNDVGYSVYRDEPIGKLLNYFFVSNQLVNSIERCQNGTVDLNAGNYFTRSYNKKVQQYLKNEALL
jgi:hypothetical protein